MAKYLHNTHGIGETGSLFPSSNDDHGVAGLDETACLSETYAELYTVIDIFHPVALCRS